jgi:hypothetical protein
MVVGHGRASRQRIRARQASICRRDLFIVDLYNAGVSGLSTPLGDRSHGVWNKRAWYFDRSTSSRMRSHKHLCCSVQRGGIQLTFGRQYQYRGSGRYNGVSSQLVHPRHVLKEPHAKPACRTIKPGPVQIDDRHRALHALILSQTATRAIPTGGQCGPHHASELLT